MIAHTIIIYALTYCGYCHELETYLRNHHIAFVEKDLDNSSDAQHEFDLTGLPHVVPQVYIDGQYIGGVSETETYCKEHHLGDL